nr:hypothetical protein [Photobacterium leiognathi]
MLCTHCHSPSALRESAVCGHRLLPDTTRSEHLNGVHGKPAVAYFPDFAEPAFSMKT